MSLDRSLAVLEGVIDGPLDVDRSVYPVRALQEAARALGVDIELEVRGDRVWLRVDHPHLDALLVAALCPP